MSGHFLAMVARCKPQWILRENVCAPDVVDFVQALEMLSYNIVLVEANSAAFTGQSRGREFVVGFDTREASERFAELVLRQSNADNLQDRTQKRQAIKCLNSRGRGGVSIYQDFVFEGPQWGFRSFTHAERGSLQGFPVGWTDGLPHSARERITGNAVTVPIVKWLGERIREAINHVGFTAVNPTRFTE